MVEIAMSIVAGCAIECLCLWQSLNTGAARYWSCERHFDFFDQIDIKRGHHRGRRQSAEKSTLYNG